MKAFNFRTLLLLLLILVSRWCFGQDLPQPRPNTYVNDFAGVLTAEQVARLNDTIRSIEQRSSIQIAIVLVNTLPADMAVEDFAMQIGRTWHVGNAENGLVYAAAIKERKQSVSVARNLEGDIPDIRALEFTENIKPFFRNEDYYGGLNNLLKDINASIDPVLKEQKKLAAAKRDKEIKANVGVLITVLEWLGVLSALFLVFYYTYLRPRRRRLARNAEEAYNLAYKQRTDKVAQDYARFRATPVVPFVPAEKKTPIKTVERKRETPPVVIVPPVDDDPPSRRSSKSDNSSSSSNDGNWGGSGDSGFSGGGASNDW